ncbi:MAG: sodium:proton antiporter [Planctomycetota bacterium]
MAVFDVVAMLLGLAALFGYVNHRLFKLPHTIGLMVITLSVSLVVLVIDACFPGLGWKGYVAQYIHQEVDFSKALMQVMLCFLLFAGALHVKIEDLLERKVSISLLATTGVLISTALVGIMVYYLFGAFGFDPGLGPCLVFGALISPTDPVAVLGLLKVAHAPRSLEAKIAGESLFNDGVGVVVFTALVAFFHMGGIDSHAVTGATDVSLLFVREVAGGVLLGFVAGSVAYLAMKSIDVYQLEVIITLALVTGIYSLAQKVFGCSGPIAVVVAGLLIGNKGKRFAMSPVTVDHMEKFWSLIDEALNSILFLLIGLEVFVVPLESARLVEAALLVIPVVLLARFISVAIPITLLKRRRNFTRGAIPILTWCGLRGGISVALVLSLEKYAVDDPMGMKLLMISTYFVVLFSVIVQGLTVRPLLSWFLKEKPE